MRVHIIRQDGPNAEPQRTPIDLPDGGTPTALEVLQHAQRTSAPDLAFRYGCRNARCGLCTVTIDGRPRLSCRDRVTPGATIGPAPHLPVVRDLVVDRTEPDHILQGKLPPLGPTRTSDTDVSAHRAALDACIRCYACLQDCPLHAQGRGNPEVFLRLERARTHPSARRGQRQDVQQIAVSLGILDACPTCSGCTCGVGIRLVRDVIQPLASASRPKKISDPPE